jgi:hypothetical protein
MSAGAALNRLAKWRTVLAGWQLGTRPQGDPESDAVRDHRELSLLLRAEVAALAALLIAKGIFTVEEFTRQVAAEAELLERALEKRFPGARATDDGITIDFAQAEAWLRNFRP